MSTQKCDDEIGWWLMSYFIRAIT